MRTGRVIQYAATSEDHFEGRGVLDTPPSRGMTAEGGDGRAPYSFASRCKNPVRSSVT